MSHASSDSDDARLLREGRIDVLLAKYHDAILGRCIARLRGHADADDVAQNVKLRLLAEFHREKSYGGLPYRVVVHQVVSWTLADYFEDRPTDSPLPDDWQPGGGEGGFDAVDSRDLLSSMFDGLPDREREVFELRYLAALEIEQIADQLGLTRNAVDQALHRGHTRLRDLLLQHG